MVSSWRGPSKERLYYFFSEVMPTMPGKSSAALTTRPNQARFLASSYSLFLPIKEHPRRNSSQGVMSGKDE